MTKQEIKQRVYQYLTSDVQSMYIEFLEADEELGDWYDQGNEKDYMDTLKELQQELNQKYQEELYSPEYTGEQLSLLTHYCVQDEIWASRRWNKELTDYIDLSGH